MIHKYIITHCAENKREKIRITTEIHRSRKFESMEEIIEAISPEYDKAGCKEVNKTGIIIEFMYQL